MSFSLLRRRWPLTPPPLLLRNRNFRSKSALKALEKASKDRVPNVALYNYPSFSGAYSAAFSLLFHSHLNRPFLILPFSSVAPLRVDDLCFEGLEKCYLLDFLGPWGFAEEISRRTSCEVIAFDHRKSVLPVFASDLDCGEKVAYHVDVNTSSSSAAYKYFSSELSKIKSCDEEFVSLLNPKDQDHVESILKYLEHTDLRQWNLPNIKAFNIGLREWRSKLNCITYPDIFEQLLKLRSEKLIDKGSSYISSRQETAKELLNNVFKVHLGQGFYGECLGVRADGNGHLNDEIGKELSIKSAAAGLRPIGAVVYMQRNNLKMSLRTMDIATDTSEVAKAYGGGGFPSSSSFIIRMDEYNQWLPINQPRRH